ncbi:alpha-factor pheromone receptor STE2 [Aspergillus undulatus]|uniref:alpha-factor pheromone receptor STE2 n=1 Tax=Aspergillus undulatus TaxID=1810928 RepID=UPI003CCDB8DA
MASDFNPWNQTVIFYDANGDPLPVPIALVDEFAQYLIRACANYAAQLGATVILLLILLLLTRAEKRGSYVFWLNCLALAFNFARSLCSIRMFTSQFVEAYAYFASDYSRVPASDYANSVLGVLFGALLLTCIQISLVLQVQVVCSNLRRIYRHALLVVSIIVALVVIAFRYWHAAINIKNILNAYNPTPYNWLESAANIVLTISICFFCVVFVTKLGIAIHMRRKLGLTEFGPMKVIFIMGCQTMIIPAILTIIHYTVEVPELASNILTLVTLSLPLSSIWAGTTPDKCSGPPLSPQLWQVLLLSGHRGTNGAYGTNTTISSTAKPSTHCYSDSRPLTMKESDGRYGSASDSSASGGGGIALQGSAVEHEISVNSARRDSYPDV